MDQRNARKRTAMAMGITLMAASLTACASGTENTGSGTSAASNAAITEESAAKAASAAGTSAAASDAASEASTSDYFAAMAAAQKEAQEIADADAKIAEQADEQADSATIYVSGYDWGPGVNKVILKLKNQVSSVTKDGAVLNTATSARSVTNAYLSDEMGNEVSESSSYITFEMETTYSASGSPFTYDYMVTMMNNWSETYPVIASFEVTEEGNTKTIGFNGDCINDRICPDTALFTDKGTYSGSYVNPMTSKSEDLTLQYAAYEPDTLTKDNAKNPLIIWLHGQGEGGTDPDIALLGNEVTALAKEDIQNYFTTKNGTDGAYVLAVQTPTYWMDGGDGTNSNGDLVSRYTEILMDTINDYVTSHPDVDTSRIYLGGCSNGGYMTMNMIISYPDYFTAAYPNCEAYAYNMYERNDDGTYKTDADGNRIKTDEHWLTDDKIKSIKDMPIWFVQSADDTTVLPESFGLPTYQALLKAGAKNVWYSYFETVESADDPGTQFMGHWSWCYTFNNEVTNVQDPSAVLNATDDEFGFVPSNDGGGSMQASDANGSYDNLFAWLNAQSK